MICLGPWHRGNLNSTFHNVYNFNLEALNGHKGICDLRWCLLLRDIETAHISGNCTATYVSNKRAPSLVESTQKWPVHDNQMIGGHAVKWNKPRRSARAGAGANLARNNQQRWGSARSWQDLPSQLHQVQELHWSRACCWTHRHRLNVHHAGQCRSIF